MPQVSLYFHTYNVVAQPAADAETVIAIITDVDTIWPSAPINLHGWTSIEPNADADGLILRIRRGSLTGDIVSPVAAVEFTPAGTFVQLPFSIDVQDTPGDTASATYVLTLECVNASGPTTVDAVHLSAQV